MQLKSLSKVLSCFHQHQKADCDLVRAQIFAGRAFFFDRPVISVTSSSTGQSVAYPSAGAASVVQCGGELIKTLGEYRELLAERGKGRVIRVCSKYRYGEEICAEFAKIRQKFYESIEQNAIRGYGSSARVHYLLFGEDDAHVERILREYPVFAEMSEAVVTEHYVVASCSLWKAQAWPYWAANFCASK